MQSLFHHATLLALLSLSVDWDGSLCDQLCMLSVPNGSTCSFSLNNLPYIVPASEQEGACTCTLSDRAAQLQWNKPQRGKVKLCSTEIRHTRACFRRTNSTRLNIKTTYVSAIGIFSRFFVFSTLEKLIYLCTGCINRGLTAPL